MITEQNLKLERKSISFSSMEEEIDSLNALAAQLILNDTDRAENLAEGALKVLQEIELTGSVYDKGQAYCMSVLGHVASLKCDFLTALPRLQKAQSLLEILDDKNELSDVMCTLGWVYFSLGDYSQATQILHQALRITAETGNTNLEARALNTLGAVYGEIGNKQESIDLHNKALKYMQGSDNLRQICLIYNNLAMTQFEIQAYEEALSNASESLKLAAKVDSPDLMASVLDTTGQIYLAKQDYREAESYFRKAQEFYVGEGTDPDEIMLNLAQAAIGQGRLDEAEQWLNQSLITSEARGVTRITYKIHQLLSEIYEKQGNLPAAIKHFKRFHEIESKVFNEENLQRLGNMIVLQQSETTRIETEIYNLQNLLLKKEITDQHQAVAEMEILATTDALTGLPNRRHFMTLSSYAFEVASSSGQALCVLMMDIDNFKNVNDQYGHLVGDQVLRDVSFVFTDCIRDCDLLGRYGGEEFAAVLPRTGVAAAQKVANRVIRKVARHLTRLGKQSVQVTISIGIAQIQKGEESLESLLERADLALYAAKRAGKNRSEKSNGI